jgi:Sec7-like guanine-nucleotide exchange factor
MCNNFNLKRYIELLEKQAKKGSPSFFAEALPISNTRKLSPMQKRVQLKMAENNFLNNLESSIKTKFGHS